jgi:Tol biopolymer transport system component
VETAANNGKQRQRGPLQIGDWVLHPDLGLLRRADEEVRLLPKALSVLLVLIDEANKGVAREDLQLIVEAHPVDTLPNRESGAQRRSLTPVIVLALVLLATAIAASFWPSGKVDTDWGQWRPLTSAPGLEHQPRLSPDGQWIIYAALKPQRPDWDLYRVNRSTGETLPIATSADHVEHGPSYSPAGDEVAYARLNDDGCQVIVQAVSLGLPRAVADCARKFPTLVDWSPDGQWLAYTIDASEEPDQRRRIYRFNLNSGVDQILSKAVSPSGSDFYPRFSPDGTQLAFLRGEPQPDHRATLWVVDLDSGEERALTHQPETLGGMTWIDGDALLYSVQQAGTMVAHRIETTSREEHAIALSGVVHPEYSRLHKTLVAARKRHDRDLAIIEADGTVRAVARSTFDDRDGRFSPDGQWLAFVSQRSGFEELWIGSSNGEAIRQLTRFEGANIGHPVWHPDGRSILFTAKGDGGEKLHLLDVMAGELSLLETPFDQVSTPDWLPGGGFVFGCEDPGFRGLCISSQDRMTKLAEGLHRPTALGQGEIAAVDDDGHLNRLSIADGQLQELWDHLPAKGRYGWTMSGDELLYLTSGKEGESGRLMRRNLSTDEETLLFEGNMPIADTRLSIDPVTGAILLTRYQASSDDLVVFSSVEFD